LPDRENAKVVVYDKLMPVCQKSKGFLVVGWDSLKSWRFLMNPTLVLMISAAIAAILHTLVPDHEIPLAMIGRTRNWTLKKMAGVTLIAGVIHISVSMGIGILALLASVAFAQYVAESAQHISGVLLVAFGAVYALISWKRKHGGHSHSHGSDPTMHPTSRAEKPVVGWSVWIVAIVGIAPCFTLIPVLLAAIPYGAATIFWVMISYATSTIGMMVVLTTVALKAIEQVTRLEKVEKHLETLAGLVIFAVGVWLMLEIQLGI